MTQDIFTNKTSDTLVVIPNWNGADWLVDCLESLSKQTYPIDIFLVDNASTDESLEIIKRYTKNYRVNHKNLGYTGGVNPGIDLAVEKNYEFVILFNNDAVADKDMINELVSSLRKSPKLGISTSKILMSDRETIDSTGDLLSIWGLPYPRGRDEIDTGQYDQEEEVFAGSGGASCYRIDMIREIGGMDDDFFAYYEDIDISARARWAGWNVMYNPRAICYHKTGSTSGKMGNFTVKMMLQNLPWLMVKNTPLSQAHSVAPRFILVYTLLAGRAIFRRQFKEFILGVGKMVWLMPKKLGQRRRIQKARKIESSDFWSLMYHDIPPGNTALRRLVNVLSRIVPKRT